MKFDIVTIFPKIFDSYFGESILKRAQEVGIVEIETHDLRDYSTNKHRNIDDTPYGGGAGMVMQVEPVYRAVTELKGKGKNLKVHTILFSAKGKKFFQEDARRLAEYDRLIMVCGRYEGVDERVAEHVVDEELSIGDYVLTGGEIPAMVIVDSVTRLLPGVLGNEQSAVTESHTEEGYLEHPQYTKPEIFFAQGGPGADGEGWKVPDVLLSGNHGEIEKWRKNKSQKRIDMN